MAVGSKVLLVEDDEPSREMMVRQLERAGYVVTSAHSMAAARRLMSSDFDMVLLDLILPDGQGWELAREWKRNVDYGHVPIVALTGMVSATDAETLCTYCDAYHLKPVSFSRLIVTMNRLLVAETPGQWPEFKWPDAPSACSTS